MKLLGLGLQVVAGPASRAARYRPPSFYRQGAPRSIRGGSAAAREDGFALAAVLYHMITGQAPDFADLGAALSPLAEAHPGLAELLLRALAPSPRARFASAQALRAALVGLDLTERRPEPVLLNCPRTWRRRLPMA